MGEPMLDKLWFIIPELILFAGAVVVATMGLSPRRRVRDLLPAITAGFLLVAFLVTPGLYASDERVAAAGFLMPVLGKFVKMTVCAIGIALTTLSVGMIDRRMEADVAAGRLGFDPLRASRGEYYAATPTT
jgi:NADH:ubiquinone oxidoreductase subunit 2 (subunit N)